MRLIEGGGEPDKAVTGRMRMLVDATELPKSALQERYTVVVEAFKRARTQGAPSMIEIGAQEWFYFAREYLDRHPEPGMFLTYSPLSDEYPYVITWVGPKRTQLRARRIEHDGQLREKEEVFTWRGNGWKLVGSRHGGGWATLGEAKRYWDPSF